MISAEHIKQLQTILPNGVSTDPKDLALHTGNLFYISNYLPDIVCYPESENDVLKVVNFCIQHKIPLIPYGSGTSVEGHIAAVHGGICLDMSKMNKILEVNIEDGYVRVQPGIPYNELNIELTKQGFHFPVEAGWGASIGGMVATNASGAGATDAGSMSKNVKSCDVVVYKQGRAAKITTATKSPKSSAGYNITNMFVGSEGTLGVITEVTLQIRRNFPVHKTISCQFNDISQAVEFVKSMKGYIQFRRIELMDKLQTEACVNFSNITFLDKDKHTVIIELAGNEGAVHEQVILLTEYLERHQTLNVRVYADTLTSKEIWMMRKNACSAAIQFIDKNKKAMATDVSVPISKLAECIQECYKHMQDLGIKAPLVAHVGDGNFHFTILVDPSNSDEIRIAKEFNARVVREALKVGGTCTGEHGIGIGKMQYLHEQHQDTVFIMEAIKRSLDPENIFNPGKIIVPKKKYFCDHGDSLGFTNQASSGDLKTSLRSRI